MTSKVLRRMQSPKDSTDSAFPEGLLEWAGYQKGGVRKPFCEGSGRPCKSVIETPLLSRLRLWTNAAPFE